jgi:hypothetical protein
MKELLENHRFLPLPSERYEFLFDNGTFEFSFFTVFAHKKSSPWIAATTRAKERIYIPFDPLCFFICTIRNIPRYFAKKSWLPKGKMAVKMGVNSLIRIERNAAALGGEAAFIFCLAQF